MKPMEQAQSERFIDTARKFGCDEDEAAFDETLKKVAKQRLRLGAEERLDCA